MRLNRSERKVLKSFVRGIEIALARMDAATGIGLGASGKAFTATTAVSESGATSEAVTLTWSIWIGSESIKVISRTPDFELCENPVNGTRNNNEAIINFMTSPMKRADVLEPGLTSKPVLKLHFVRLNWV